MIILIHKFKEGDIVLIKDKLPTIRTDNKSLSANPKGEMDKYCGTKCVVSEIYDIGDIPAYLLENVEDNNYTWIWAEEWLELVNPMSSITIDENEIEGLFNE